MTPSRGEIWLVDFGDPVGREPSGHRPAAVVSADGLNAGRSGVVIVVPCTTARRGLVSHVELDAVASGLVETSYAKCEDVKSVAVERLVTRLGRADTVAMDAITRVMRILMEL